ncbi:MAG: hypothetical protein DI596_03820 [Azospira oryzae]|nr:MAG: hypothetical protein DI596_03820 [Azospira oryzae]PZP81607.1 MAG: hypothetical protein DI593_03820 [Azospira oryzae]
MQHPPQENAASPGGGRDGHERARARFGARQAVEIKGIFSRGWVGDGQPRALEERNHPHRANPAEG